MRQRVLTIAPFSYALLCAILFVCVYTLAPMHDAHAQTTPKLPIGESCQSDSQCASNECEDSTLKSGKDAYCVCDTANDCALASNKDKDPENWNCKNGMNASHDLNYCLHNKNGPIFAVKPTSTSGLDVIFDTTAANTINADELEHLIDTPVVKIAIPGLQFQSLEDIKLDRGDDGNIYLFFPYVGQYIEAAYKYLIAFAGVMSVVMIMHGGLTLVLSGGSSEKITHAKQKILRSLVGLFLAVTSYSLLYLINPELVNFRNLRIPIDYTAPSDDEGLHDGVEKLRKCTEKDKELGYTSYKEINTSTLKKIQQKDGNSDCSQFAPCLGGALACLKACIEQLDPSQRTKVSSYGTSNKITGALDCSTKSNTRGAAPARTITTIGLHQGRVDINTVHFWWFKKYKKLMKGERSIGIATHYYITQAGQAVQLMDERFIANHGVHNSRSIGIDINPVCTKNETWTSSKKWQRCRYTGAQYDGLKRLIANLRKKYGNLRVVPHCSVKGSNHTDPWNFDYSRLQPGLNASWYNPPLNATSIDEGLVFSRRGRCRGLFKPPKKAPKTIYGCCVGKTIKGDNNAELATKCQVISGGTIGHTPGACGGQSVAKPTGS